MKNNGIVVQYGDSIDEPMVDVDSDTHKKMMKELISWYIKQPLTDVYVQRFDSTFGKYSAEQQKEDVANANQGHVA